MKLKIISLFVTFLISLNSLALENENSKFSNPVKEILSNTNIDVEKLWIEYAKSKGGLTWGISKEYPDYDKVKEGDTIIIQLTQGSCLMEFFHSRWRRANDVRRWDDSINTYGACPYVFD